MEVKVNQSNVSIASNSCTLLELLQMQSMADKLGIAVAVNNAVVPKKQWGSKQLLHLDSVTIIKATQGG